MNNILLASHGTVGAQAAERRAFELCEDDGCITHLYVVPEFWQHMLGDDWLNNASTRERFCDYLENELAQEAEQQVGRIQKQAKQLGLHSINRVVVGEPQRCLIDFCKESSFDLVVIGSPRPKGSAGLRSRMATKPVARKVGSPLLVVPHPDA